MFSLRAHANLLVLQISDFLFGEMKIQINTFQDIDFFRNLNAIKSGWFIAYIEGPYAIISNI